MIKSLKKLRNITFIIFGVEAVIFVLLVVALYLNWFNINEVLEFYHLIIGFSVLFVLDALVYWFGLLSLNRKRTLNDFEAASLVSNDIQSAYNFGQIGLLVIDEENVVIWTSNLFPERNMNLVDTKVFEWKPELKELVDAPVGKNKKINVSNSVYEVSYLSEPRLFIFKDRTDYESLLHYSNDNAMVLGIVQIDNYDDVASDTDESAAYVTKVRTLTVEYFRNMGVLLRMVRADTYFAICNSASLDALEADKFSILDEIHKSSDGQRNRLTLSIGFAHNFADTAKLNEMASTALDVALSRGGDQAVVSHYGKELAFYGGKTAAVENTSKIKIRTFADSLITLIKDASDVYVMGHTEADMDALGACLGIMAICHHLNKPVKMIYDPNKAEKKTRLAFKNAFPKDVGESMTISPSAALTKIQNRSLLVVTDVAVPANTMCPAALEKASKIIVIDHHMRGDHYIERPVLDMVDPSACAASELIAEMIYFATENPRIELSPSYATLMLSGIFLDSNYFKSKSTGRGTFAAAQILKEYGADNTIAYNYLKDDYDEFQLINKILGTMATPHFGIIYCKADEKELVERSTLAKVANEAMRLQGISACFVIGRTDEKTVRISARGDGSVSVGLLMQKLGGGGHYSMAACARENTTIKEMEKELLEVLDTYLESAREYKNIEGD